MKMTLTILALIQFLNQTPNPQNLKDAVTGERGDDVAWRQTVSFAPGHTLGACPFRNLQGGWVGLPSVSLEDPIELSL